jgi:hypothetical protein
MITNMYQMDYSRQNMDGNFLSSFQDGCSRQFDIQWVRSRPSSFTPISILDVLESTADESDYSSDHRGSRSTERSTDTQVSSNCTSPVGSNSVANSMKAREFLMSKNHLSMAKMRSFDSMNSENLLQSESNKILWKIRNTRTSRIDATDIIHKVSSKTKESDWKKGAKTDVKESSSIVEQEEVTTLMIRNFPHPCSSYEPLLEHLRIHGIDVEKDINFIYIPFAHRKFQSLGFAFVNFCTPKKAEAFLQRSQGTKLFSFENQNRSLHIAPAQKQGVHANLVHLVETSVHVDNLLETRHQPLFNNAVDGESSEPGLPTSNLFSEKIAELAQMYQSPPKIRYLMHKLQSFNEI